ncbi:hypothetical protein KUA02_00860 [Komagataeibacter pomaceti]|nr:hypothetical protein [Novacetimonas pomaceti]
MLQFHKRFQFPREFAAVMQQALMVIGNTPRTRIDVIARCETDLLGAAFVKLFVKIFTKVYDFSELSGLSFQTVSKIRTLRMSHGRHGLIQGGTTGKYANTC